MVKLNMPKFVSQTSSVSSRLASTLKAEALPVQDTKGCFSGWLNKKTHNKMVANTFQKRFFILSNDALSYAKKPEAVEVEGELTEHPLSDLEWVKLCGKEDVSKEFEVSFKTRVLTLEAPDSATAHQWVSRIHQATQAAKGEDQWSSSRANRTSSTASKEEEGEQMSSAQHGRFSGWLKKKSHNKVVANTFQKRFFVLSNDALSYAKKPEAVEVEGELTEHPLSDLEWVRLCGQEDACTEFEVSFKSRVLTLEAPSSAAAQQWVSHIQQAAQAAQGEDQRSFSGPNPHGSKPPKEEALKEMISARGARFSGWLSKKSHNKMVANSFQKRFFILSNDTLSYVKKPEDYALYEGQLTEHSLSELEWVKLCGEDDFCKEFEVSFKSRVLHLKAPDSASAQQWVSSIEQAALPYKGEDQRSTPRPNPTSSPTSPPASKEQESGESKQEVTQFQADAPQQHENDVMKLPNGEAEAEDSSGDDSDQVPPQPPPTRKHSVYRSLNQGLNLDLDTGPQRQEDEVWQQQQEQQQQHRPPSPRSMLANPARFSSSMTSQSTWQYSHTRQGPHQPDGPASMRSSSRPSDSDGEAGSPVGPPHPHLGHTNPLFVASKSPNPSEHQTEALGSAAFSPRAQASHASRLPSREGPQRPGSALNRSFLQASGQAPLRPRLLQPDAPLPEAVPKPGLHHAIALQKAQNRRRSGEGAEGASERLELEPQAGGDGKAHRGGSTPQNASPPSSMQSSMGSARNPPPRLLNGAAASRAPPPPLDERIELPPPNYPKQPPVPRPTPSTDNGRLAQRSPADHQASQGGGIDRTELEENWDSDEEEQGTAGEQPPQHQPSMPTREAKSHSRVPQSQQQQRQQQQQGQGMESHHATTAGNSWDEDDDDDKNNGGVQHVQPKLPEAPAPPPSGRSRPARPVPPTAPHSSSAAAVRQQQAPRPQKQQQQQREQDVVVGARDRHVSAGVTEDRNWVEENWDSDEN
ncbi:hypothetical protein DUNSADRAFT_4967 [Dunaliella salina]|uniref:PH domain-containing protein n=1 Tax=Dunaliella salina TaxID=3046 RepID=A0ABQ7GQV5_DUNSA|nr:hypothetical protein DUNSADRAFT_4967 [Dunaliella salina]|eukprot:KAF5836994.1 hypothetical protein DUNSADRAFT_4967 [Dunaliella salina]